YLLVADRAVVLLVQEVEVELVLGDGAVDAHRRVHEPERDRPRPERAWRHLEQLCQPPAGTKPQLGQRKGRALRTAPDPEAAPEQQCGLLREQPAARSSDPLPGYTPSPLRFQCHKHSAAAPRTRRR